MEKIFSKMGKFRLKRGKLGRGGGGGSWDGGGGEGEGGTEMKNKWA